MPNIYKGDIGFTGQQAAVISERNIGDDLNYSVSSGNLLLTDKKTGEMFSYEDEPQTLENASAGRLKVSEPALHCPTCASRMISYVRGKRKISIPFCPIHGHESLEAYSNLYCNAFRNDAVRHFEAEDDPDFDPEKADRNKDGKISSWERTVGNAVAKSMREQKRADYLDNTYQWSVTMDAMDRDDFADAVLDISHREIADEAEQIAAESFGAELTGSDFYPVGEGRIIGAITGDSQFSPLGANAEEDVYYSERQTTDFGMVGGGNDFGQNRAEMMQEMSRSVSGGRLWVTTAMLAIGFVAGIAFKDMKQDTSSE